MPSLAIKMRGILLFLTLFPTYAFSQNLEVGNSFFDINSIRDNQKKVAAENDVTISFNNFDARFVSGIEGIPLPLRNLTFSTKEDIIEIIDVLYPYYGFQGTESLVFDSKSNISGNDSYIFREYINDIESPEFINIIVSTNSGRITSIRGTLTIDSGFEVLPSISQEESKSIVYSHIQNSEETEIAGLNISNFDAEITYRSWGTSKSLEPVWKIYPDISMADYFYYWVDPQGIVHGSSSVDP